MDQKYEKKINTVFEDDLDDLLMSRDLLDKFNQKKIKCKFCRSIINRENIYSLLPESGSVNLICNKPECIIVFMEYLENKTKHNANI